MDSHCSSKGNFSFLPTYLFYEAALKSTLPSTPYAMLGLPLPCPSCERSSTMRTPLAAMILCPTPTPPIPMGAATTSLASTSQAPDPRDCPTSAGTRRPSLSSTPPPTTSSDPAWAVRRRAAPRRRRRRCRGTGGRGGRSRCGGSYSRESSAGSSRASAPTCSSPSSSPSHTSPSPASQRSAATPTRSRPAASPPARRRDGGKRRSAAC
jgi:hypothetical protein